MLGKAPTQSNMKAAETTSAPMPTAASECQITLPTGLLGFETIKHYLLIVKPDEEPFMWLQMLADPNQAFLVLSPFVVMPSYSPDLGEDDVRSLGLRGPEDAVLLSIATLHGDGRATVNLKGPIVLNRHTLVAKQIVPTNAQQYAVQHPLPVDR